jgi:parallel beta-helix repeat protein
VQVTYFKRLGLAFAVLLAASVYAPSPAYAEKIFNVKTYGAVGDGTTDDTKALIAAAAAANAVPGSTLLFPTGNYLLGGVLTVKGIDVAGERATLTVISAGVLKISGNNTKVHNFQFASQSPSHAVGLSVDQANGFEVRNNLFDSFNQAMSVLQSSNGKIEGNEFLSNAGSTELYLSGSSNITAHDNTFRGINGTAVYIGTSNNVTLDDNFFGAVDFSIMSSQNSFVNYTNNQFFAGLKDTINLNGDKRVAINGNKFANSKHVNIKASNVTFMDLDSNVSRTPESFILLVGSKIVNIRDNTVEDAADDAIIGSGVTQIEISDNKVAGAGRGIHIHTNSDTIKIAGNRIADLKYDGIVLTTCTGTNVISKNTISNCGQSNKDNRLKIAVIFANTPQADVITIEGNTYSGATAGVNYFIWCVQGEPPADISGNRTSTSLPNRIGS